MNRDYPERSPVEHADVTPQDVEPDQQPLSQADRILSWLGQYGFAYNPFESTNSEQDVRLTEHFVEQPDFEQMLDLQDQLLFARTGDGKTATRLRLQSFYRDAVRDHHVFAFSYLIPQELADSSAVTLESHLDALLTAAVRHAFVFFALRGIDLPALQDEGKAEVLARRFAAYFDRYYGATTWRDDLRRALIDLSLDQAMGTLGSVYDDLDPLDAVGSVNIVWLKRWLNYFEQVEQQKSYKLATKLLQRWQNFCELVQAADVQTILALVDGVDVRPSAGSQDDSSFVGLPAAQIEKKITISRMVALLTPLLELLREKQLGTHTVTKIFLPIELYLPLIPHLSIQIAHVILFWDHQRLSQLLQFRLKAASHGAVTSLLQLVEEDVPKDLESFLIVQSGSSPRYLIHYLNKIFSIHVTQPDNKLPGKLTGGLLSQFTYTPHRSP